MPWHAPAADALMSFGRLPRSSSTGFNTGTSTTSGLPTSGGNGSVAALAAIPELRAFVSETCASCARAKVKCDKTKPRCNRCVRLNIPCGVQFKGRGKSQQLALDVAIAMHHASGHLGATAATAVAAAAASATSSLRTERGFLEGDCDEGSLRVLTEARAMPRPPQRGGSVAAAGGAGGGSSSGGGGSGGGSSGGSPPAHPPSILSDPGGSVGRVDQSLPMHPEAGLLKAMAAGAAELLPGSVRARDRADRADTGDGLSGLLALTRSGFAPPTFPAPPAAVECGKSDGATGEANGGEGEDEGFLPFSFDSSGRGSGSDGGSVESSFDRGGGYGILGGSSDQSAGGSFGGSFDQLGSFEGNFDCGAGSGAGGCLDFADWTTGRGYSGGGSLGGGKGALQQSSVGEAPSQKRGFDSVGVSCDDSTVRGEDEGEGQSDDGEIEAATEAR